MATASTAQVQDLESRIRKVTYRSIHEMPDECKVERPLVAAVDIERWVAARTEATVVSGADTKIHILCAFPEKVTVAAPCLAVARFADRVESLGLDGKTHRWNLDEIQA